MSLCCGRAQNFAFDITTRTCEVFCILVFLSVCLFACLLLLFCWRAGQTGFCPPTISAVFLFAFLLDCLFAWCLLSLPSAIWKSRENPQDLVYVQGVLLLFFYLLVCLLFVVVLMARRADRCWHHGLYVWTFCLLFVCLLLFFCWHAGQAEICFYITDRTCESFFFTCLFV